MTLQRYVVGIDLGGTNVRVGLAFPSGELLLTHTWPTQAERGPDAVIARIQSGVEQVAREAGVDRAALVSVGIGAPGPIDVPAGVVSCMPNLPGWQQVPLRARLAQALQLPVALGNDGNVAALGEHRFGAGRGASDMVYVAIGTGLGGGIIVNNQLCAGTTGAAGEIGHVILDPQGPLCGCGNRGCLETYCSGSGLERLAAQRLREGRSSALSELARPRGGALTAHLIAQAAREGDPLAKELFAQAAAYLGLGLVMLVHLLNPELVVFGGGLGAVTDLLVDPGVALAQQWTLEQHRKGLRFSQAQLGDRAGVLGAAALALDTFETRST